MSVGCHFVFAFIDASLNALAAWKPARTSGALIGMVALRGIV
jgi:hypothetical protein